MKKKVNKFKVLQLSIRTDNWAFKNMYSAYYFDVRLSLLSLIAEP